MRMKFPLHEILELHTVQDLKNMAKEFGVSGYSKLKKGELAALLCENILKEDTASEKLLCATNREIEHLEKAIREEVIIEENTFWYEYWERICFAFITTDKEVRIPAEITEMYEKIKNDDSYRRDRERAETLFAYARACTNLYSLIDNKKFLEIINAQTGLAMNQEELERWMKIRRQFRGCQLFFMEDSYIMDEIYGMNDFGIHEDYQEMLKEQGSKPYYVPGKEELLKYADGIYTEENEAYLSMLSYMKGNMGMDEASGRDVCADIQLMIRHDAMPGRVLAECERIGVTFASNEIAAGFLQQIMQMYNHTRIAGNRGYTPEEISILNPSAGLSSEKAIRELQDMMVKFQNQAQTATAARRQNGRKIYPNEPCPCGSGKKYKKCCGK